MEVLYHSSGLTALSLRNKSKRKLVLFLQIVCSNFGICTGLVEKLPRISSLMLKNFNTRKEYSVHIIQTFSKPLMLPYPV